MYTAKEAVEVYVAGSEKRAKNSALKVFVLAIFAGMFIGFGAAGSSLAVHNIDNVGVARLVAGVVFPVGLMMVLLTGAELFTGNCLFIMGTVEKKFSVATLVKILVLVYLGNFVGGVLLSGMILASGQWDYTAGLLGAYTIKVAAGKAVIPFGKAIISGILCNILVAGAVFMAVCAKDIIGKLFCAFFPIMLFVVCGFEHCVANMYYIPAGIMAASNDNYVNVAMEKYGMTAEQIAAINWQNFFVTNQIPVTIGNIIGGMVFIGLPLLFLYRDSKKNS